METLSYCQLMQRCGELEAQVKQLAAKAELHEAAEKAGIEEWQVKRNGPGEYALMVKGSLVKYSGWSTHLPVADEVVDKKTADFIANASPSNILALLAERDADKKRIADIQEQLARYSMSPGEADQRRCESRAVRDALGFGKDADNVAPVDLREKIDAFRLRIAELEARTVSVKLPKNTVLAEAPDHIWLQTAGEWPANAEFSELTWCSDRQHDDDTLYVRADLAAGIKLEE